MKLKPLDQQTIVITGGSSGIGLATARMAAQRGANVVIIARGEDGLEKAAQQIRAQGGRCDTISADVGKREDVKAAVETVIERHGGFDTWVSNAGVAVYSKLEDLSDEDHRRLFDTNYWGVVHGATEALPHLKQRGGALITTGSISSQMRFWSLLIACLGGVAAAAGFGLIPIILAPPLTGHAYAACVLALALFGGIHAGLAAIGSGFAAARCRAGFVSRVRENDLLILRLWCRFASGAGPIVLLAVYLMPILAAA